VKILIVGTNYHPEKIGIGKYTGEMAEWLAEHGHEVRVVTAPPYYPQWRVTEGYSNGWSRQEAQQAKQVQVTGDNGQANIGHLVIYRCPLWVPAKPSGLKRVLHLASFALSSLPIMLWQILWKPDLVLIIEPPLFCAPGAWLIARLSGAKAWLHVQDLEVDAAFDLGLLPSGKIRKLILFFESFLLRRFDKVSTIASKMAERLETKGINPEKIVLFPNWVEITGLRIEDTGLIGFRAELGIEADAVVALYSGNMGGKQGLEILAQVAKLQAQGAGLVPEVIFVFCGNGAGRADLVALCDGLPNVRFMDLQPLERLGELLAMADIHLLPQRANAADLMMPSKLTGMLASSRPVVATANAETELANVVSGCGLVVPPEQPQAFADAINTLAQDAMMRIRLGKAGRAYAEANLDREVLLGRFESELKTLVES
jgi:colanic acid biosynthesis glycosyl transferase WcaI